MKKTNSTFNSDEFLQQLRYCKRCGMPNGTATEYCQVCYDELNDRETHEE